jgi:hypothetical protein
MAEAIVPPFSARYRGPQAQINNDCPETARIGLLHLLRQLVDKDYVEDWKAIATELQRIARFKPGFESHLAYDLSEEILLMLDWGKVFDFCERLYNHLAQDAWRYNHQTEDHDLIAKKSDVQEYIAGELQRLFLEENLAFEFSKGLVRRRGRRNTADQVARAELVLGDPKLSLALGHFNKALNYFRNVSLPDYENVVKEAVCAVEATARALFPSGGSTLGEVVNSIAGSEPGQLPKSIANTFHGLYGFRNGGQGVGHGGATGGAATKEIAEYALAVAASQIVFLVDFAATLEQDVPF